MPVVYSLTPLTGRRRNENRRMVVATVEIKRRTFLVAGASLLASAPVTGLLAMLVGVWAIIVPLLFIGAGLWLWDSRQRKGLKLLNYQAILDTRRARNGVLYAAGRVVPDPVIVMHQRQFLPLVAPEREAPLAHGRNNLSDARARRRSRRSSAKARFE